MRRMAGMSLVELMIAMVIGLVVMLGVVQVFAASRQSYQLSEGLARVQENSRFAMDTLQRELRMAGHFGCINDQAHTIQNPGSLFSTLNASAHPSLNFMQSIQGYEATGTAPGDTIALSATPDIGGNAYSPALPDELANALSNRVDGSDIVALRYLMPDGVPITSSTGGSRPVFSFDAARLGVLRSGMTDPGLYGVADCTTATVFQARAVDAAGGTVTFGDAPNNTSLFTSVYKEGQTMLHRAESIVFYVGYDADNAQSSLYRVRFTATPAGALVAGAPEAMVEGVENLQLLYGQDRELTSTSPTGFIDRQGSAEQVQASMSDTTAAWRRVGAVQLGMVVSSPDRASARQADGAAALTTMGVTFTAPTDGRMRGVYQTTVAIRNRLYGN
jgi:type IV pilus assembly protein PilW